MTDSLCILSGRYEVCEVIGYGGMATIHRGVDRMLNREIAIKILKAEYADDSEMVQRFINEAKAMMVLDHPHIVRVYGVSMDDGIYYITMELVQGDTLKELIQRWGRIPVKQAIQWGMDVCDALSYAHSKRIIHRDIKPENILISRDGLAKITDFGIAKVLGGTSLTKMDGDVLGSVEYIAPEQARGDETDEKTDIYSLGASIYEMLTGRVPFTADTPVAVAMKHIQAVVIPPINLEPDVPYSLSSVVVKALAKNPINRYASMADFYDDLYRSVREPDGTFADTVDQSIEVLDEKPLDPKKSAKRISKICGIVVAVLVLSFIVGKAVLESGRGALLTVPTVKGQYVDIATDTLGKAGLNNYEIRLIHNDASEGTVLECSPLEGEVVEAGTKITLTVSDGPEKITVPGFVGKNYQDAIVEMERVGLSLGTVEYSPQSNTPSGAVISQSPSANQMVPAGTMVNLAVDGINPDDVTHTTPVLGITVAEAKQLLTTDGYSRIVVCEEISSGENRGLVLRQLPGGGNYGKKEELCKLYVGAYRTRKVTGMVRVSVTVPSDDCDVVVTVVESDGEFIMYEGTADAGQTNVKVDLNCIEDGKKTLRIYCDGIFTGQTEIEL